MATNGQSARKWLEENQGKVPLARIRQIRDNILTKLQSLEDQDQLHEGLLEALDVMEDHLLLLEHAKSQPANPVQELDTGPLIPAPPEETPNLSPAEKQRRFEELLKTGKVDL